MFGLSWEHLLVVGIVLLIFGPRKLPELGSGLGKAIRNFKEGLSGKQPGSQELPKSDPKPEIADASKDKKTGSDDSA